MLQTGEHPGADSLRLAFVVRHSAQNDLIWKLFTEGFKQGLRCVFASVIHKAEGCFRVTAGEFHELAHGETAGFIVAGNNDADRVHEHAA